MKEWFARFRQDFGFWSQQSVISALPGFCIAMWLAGFSGNFDAFLAILAALFTMILAVTALMSIWPSLTGWRTLPSRGLRVGLVLRAICSGMSLVFIAVLLAIHGQGMNPILLLLPDVWTGLGSALLVGMLAEPLGFGDPVSKIVYGSGDLGFVMVYLIALIDGLLLCLLVFVWSFVSMLVLQIRDRKKLCSGYEPRMIDTDDGSGVRGNPG